MASTPLYYDLVMETSTTTGTGTLTLAGAVAGYQSFAVVGNGKSCNYSIQAVDTNGNPTGDYEVGIGTYTSSGTTLSRDKIFASSNSGSAVSLSAGTKRVFLVSPAALAIPSLFDVGGRLTLTSGTPVTTANVTAAATVYFTPYKGNNISLYNGNGWVRYAFSELSLALGTISSGKPYDVFLYDNAGTLTLELLAWTNGTTRATALAYQDGVLCKTGALTRRYLGTFYTTATTTTEDSTSYRYLYNYYNRVYRNVFFQNTTGHTYNGAIRNWNNDATTHGFLLGVLEDTIHLSVDGAVEDLGAVAIMTLALDGTDYPDRIWTRQDIPSTYGEGGMGRAYNITTSPMAVGVHTFVLREQSNGASGQFDEIAVTVGLWA